MQNHRIVLLGVLGSGKTTLYNKITNAQNVVKYGGKSVTQQIYLKQSAYGMGFEIMDTPGFMANSNKLLHAAAVVAALSEGELNRIIITVKFERITFMENYFKLVLAPCTRFKDIITVIVTHWDLSENKAEDQKEILQCFARYNISSVLFKSRIDTGLSICAQLDMILVQSKFRSVKLTDAEICSQFDLVSLTNETDTKISQDQLKIIQQFRKISGLYLAFINNFDGKKSNVVNVMHALIQSVRSQADSEILKFEKNQGRQILDLVDLEGNNISYLYYIILKKALFKDVEYVIMAAQKKNCPHCGLVWMKVNGCDGETTCGQKIEGSIDEVLQEGSSLGRVKVEVTNYRLIVTDPDDVSSFSQWFKNLFSSKQLPKQQLTTGLINAEYKGCKKKIVWKDIPPLSIGKLAELISPDLFSYFQNQEQIQRDELFFLENTYKELVHDAIAEQKKMIIKQY